MHINTAGNTFDVHDVTFDSCLKLGNGVVTDGAGNLTGIYVAGDAYAQGTIDTIQFNSIHNIDAAGQIVLEDTSGIYVITPCTDSANQVTIRNVNGYNFGKRLIRVHASNITIDTVRGESDEGDTLSVIGFNNGEGLGDKTGSTVSHARAYGKMSYAFATDAIGTQFHDITAFTRPSDNPEMGNFSFGMFISNDDTLVEGYESDSERLIGIGSGTRMVRNTTLRNLNLHINSEVSNALQLVNGMQGFDGLLIDGLEVDYDATCSSVVPVVQASLYLNEATRGNNVVIRNCSITSASPAAGANAFSFKYCDNVSLQSCRYTNTSSSRHGYIASFDHSSNVSVDGLAVDGACQAGVYLGYCDGTNPISQVQTSDASVAAVYSVGSSGVTVQNCTSYTAN